LNGIEIIRRVLAAKWLNRIRGTLIAVPIVNVMGCIHRSRYLPDRRDLNRCFPGSEKGSLGARIANLFVRDILSKVNYAIDLHTGAINRPNLPQVRVHLENEKAAMMARSFGVPVILDAPIRDGSFRGAGDDLGVPIMTYEAGEAMRFHEHSIDAGVFGVRNVMESLSMLPKSKRKRCLTSFVAKSSQWVRSPADGILRSYIKLGQRIHRGELIGIVDGPLGGSAEPIHAAFSGIVVGATNLPLVNEGEALFHIARFEEIDQVQATVEEFRTELSQQPAN
jgi:predicted deacylase